jgi:hypothetical protein
MWQRGAATFAPQSAEFEREFLGEHLAGGRLRDIADCLLDWLQEPRVLSRKLFDQLTQGIAKAASPPLNKHGVYILEFASVDGLVAAKLEPMNQVRLSGPGIPEDNGQNVPPCAIPEAGVQRFLGKFHPTHFVRDVTDGRVSRQEVINTGLIHLRDAGNH